MAKEISSEMLKVSDILLEVGKKYIIPDFQRDFVWGKDEVTKLLEDFEEDSNEYGPDIRNMEGYLLGNIVLIDDESEERLVVVDGQQRLTTLSLVFKALNDVIKKKMNDGMTEEMKSHWNRILADLNAGYEILDENYEFESLKITHDSSLNFGNYYKKLIHETLGESDRITNSSDKQISEVYNTIFDYLISLEETSLKNFIVYFKTKVKLVVTTAYSKSKAFQLFEVLNDRGRSLEPLDLIKNGFLKTLSVEGASDEQLKEFGDNWKSFLENLVLSGNRKISSSIFLKHFIVANYGESIKQEELFKFFYENEKEFKKVQSILKISAKLKKQSEIYRELEKGNYDKFISRRYENNIFLLFKVLGIKQLHSMLMPFYDSTEEKKLEVLDLCLRFGASVIFSFTPTHYIEKTLPTIIKDYLKADASDSAFQVFVDKINALIESNVKNVKAVLPTRDFTNASGSAQGKAMVILKFIELYFNRNPHIKAPETGRVLSVEHILSRELEIPNNDYTFLNMADEKEFKEHLNLIGNLTILYVNENSHLNNEQLKDKKTIYETCEFKITTAIVVAAKTELQSGPIKKHCDITNDYLSQFAGDNFKKEEIITRSVELTNLLAHILLNGNKE